ncbi:MAG: hypothetical protein PHR66_02955 [Desulfuromonadaceae bacterium]|nr:hypothetical protein [Desulfuromonadaceae bacterium]
MEPIVIVAAVLLIYGGYIAMLDEIKAWQRSRGVRTRRAARSSLSSRNKAKASTSCPEDGVAAHPDRFLGFNLDVVFNDKLRRQLGSIRQG